MIEAPFDVEGARRQFPALARQVNGHAAVYFDGPGGTQVPRQVADAVSRYLLGSNANSHGTFATSRETDAMLEASRAAVADLLGSDDPETIAFGPNMTTLTLALSRALAREWQSGDEVIVTRLDHDANVSPWVLAARDAGARVHHVAIRTSDCTLDLDDFKAKLSSRTRLVAVGCASNAVGTLNPIRELIGLAHEAGAEVFLDAVHYAPHALIDVAAWDCDWLALSAYKFFGPHVGMLWGRRKRLEQVEAYKLRPAPNDLSGKWMTGTQNHEGIAGTLAAVDYLASLGRPLTSPAASRREALAAAFAAIGSYERQLAARLLAGLKELPVRVYGIADCRRLEERLPTVGITAEAMKPAALARHLAERGIFVWHGNFYALSLSEELGLEPHGMVRIGLAHYNTPGEIDRLLAELRTVFAQA